LSDKDELDLSYEVLLNMQFIKIPLLLCKSKNAYFFLFF